MVNTTTDALIVVPKTLRNKIKSKAATLGISMREYLNRLLAKDE